MGLFDLPFGKKRRELQQQRQEIDKAWAKLKEFTADNQYAMQVLSQIALHNGVPAFSYDLAKFINNGYVKNPNVYSVINKILQPAKEIPWLVYKVKDKKALKHYQAFKAEGRTVEAYQYAKKALELVEGTPFNKMFEDKANDLQTWPEFVEQSLGYKLLAGNDFIYKFRAAGFKYATQLYCLPAAAVEIIPGSLHSPVKGYKIVNNNQVLKHFEPEDIIHRKTFNPTFTFGVRPEDYLFGMSPLAPLCRTIDMSNQSIDAMLALFLNGGPPGILTQDTSGTEGNPMTPNERKDMEDGWRRNYGGGKKANLPIFAPIKLDWVATGLSSVDLQLIEADASGLKKIAGVYSVPLPLVVNDEAAFNNINAAKKSLYTDAIIPALTDLREAINKGVVAEYNLAQGTELWVDFDLKGIPVLQENLKEKSEILLAEMDHGVWTGNEYRTLMDYDVDESDNLLNQRMLLATLKYSDVDSIPEGYKVFVSVINSMSPLVANKVIGAMTEDELRALVGIGALPDGAETINQIMNSRAQDSATTPPKDEPEEETTA